MSRVPPAGRRPGGRPNRHRNWSGKGVPPGVSPVGASGRFHISDEEFEWRKKTTEFAQASLNARREKGYVVREKLSDAIEDAMYEYLSGTEVSDCGIFMGDSGYRYDKRDNIQAGEKMIHSFRRIESITTLQPEGFPMRHHHREARGDNYYYTNAYTSVPRDAKELALKITEQRTTDQLERQRLANERLEGGIILFLIFGGPVILTILAEAIDIWLLWMGWK